MARLFVPLDVNLPDDPAIVRAGADAELLYIRGLLLAKRIGGDGAIDRAHLFRLAGDLHSVVCGETNPKDIASELVSVGLWLETPDGWQIRSWLEHNPSDEEIEEQRKSERDRKSRWRQSRQSPTSRDVDVPPESPVPATPRDAHRGISESESEENYRATAPRSTPVPDEDFDDWWSTWPKKLDKAQAKAQYVARRRQGIPHDQLVTARDNYVRSKDGDVQHMKYPATFLHGRDGPWSEFIGGIPAAALSGNGARALAQGPQVTTRERDGRTERFYPGTGWV